MKARWQLLLSLAVLTSCMAGPPDIMSWPEYVADSGSYSWPYILNLRSTPGALLYYGARHSYAPDDPQLARIEELWEDFQPTIALNEGGHPPVEASREEAIRKHGEAGLLRFLAAQHDVPVTTLDPSRAQEVAWLRRTYPVEQIKLFFLLRSATQYVAREGDSGLPFEMERVLRIYHATPGLREPPSSWAELGTVYEKYFPDRGPIAHVPETWFDPARHDTLLNGIARDSSDYRDRFVINVLAGHVREGHRVFAVMGGSHVVRQERRLRWALRHG